MSNTGKKITKQYQQKLDKYDAQIKKAKAMKRAIYRKEQEKLRKLRTRRLIEIGGLAEIAELTNCEKGVLLGIFLQGRKLIEDESTYRNLKKLGDSTLRYREQQRVQKKASKES